MMAAWICTFLIWFCLEEERFQWSSGLSQEEAVVLEHSCSSSARLGITEWLRIFHMSHLKPSQHSREVMTAPDKSMFSSVLWFILASVKKLEVLSPFRKAFSFQTSICGLILGSEQQQTVPSEISFLLWCLLHCLTSLPLGKEDSCWGRAGFLLPSFWAPAAVLAPFLWSGAVTSTPLPALHTHSLAQNSSAACLGHQSTKINSREIQWLWALQWEQLAAPAGFWGFCLLWC